MIASLAADLKNLKSSAKFLRSSSTEKRNKTLHLLSEKLLTQKTTILAANAQDLAGLTDQSVEYSDAFRDRLTLTDARIECMRVSIEQIASFGDPLGEVVESKTLINGLQTKKVRAPLGVIFMIFESRPNVAIEAFALAVKSGNALLLRGGKESAKTCAAFYSLITQSLMEAGLPGESFFGITDPDRAIVSDLLQQKKYIDVVIPRGGDQLIEFVVENSRIPIIKNDRGMCHVYVHEDADLTMTRLIVENAKTQRPGVCNAMETLLIHENCAVKVLQLIANLPVQFFACAKSLKILYANGCTVATAAQPENFDTEYLDLKMNVKVVSTFDEAISHIEEHGSKHSEAIITSSATVAKRFEAEVDAAVVYWNASTRFTDGFELGLGGEIGISTQKLHVRGPVGLRELTSLRWIIEGTGQVRE